MQANYYSLRQILKSSIDFVYDDFDEFLKKYNQRLLLGDDPLLIIKNILSIYQKSCYDYLLDFIDNLMDTVDLCFNSFVQKNKFCDGIFQIEPADFVSNVNISQIQILASTESVNKKWFEKILTCVLSNDSLCLTELGREVSREAYYFSFESNWNNIMYESFSAKQSEDLSQIFFQSHNISNYGIYLFATIVFTEDEFVEIIDSPLLSNGLSGVDFSFAAVFDHIFDDMFGDTLNEADTSNNFGCKSGYYISDAQCQPCPVGMYCPTAITQYSCVNKPEDATYYVTGVATPNCPFKCNEIYYYPVDNECIYYPYYELDDNIIVACANIPGLTLVSADKAQIACERKIIDQIIIIDRNFDGSIGFSLSIDIDVDIGSFPEGEEFTSKMTVGLVEFVGQWELYLKPLVHYGTIVEGLVCLSSVDEIIGCSGNVRLDGSMNLTVFYQPNNDLVVFNIDSTLHAMRCLTDMSSTPGTYLRLGGYLGRIDNSLHNAMKGYIFNYIFRSYYALGPSFISPQLPSYFSKENIVETWPFNIDMSFDQTQDIFSTCSNGYLTLEIPSNYMVIVHIRCPSCSLEAIKLYEIQFIDESGEVITPSFCKAPSSNIHCLFLFDNKHMLQDNPLEFHLLNRNDFLLGVIFDQSTVYISQVKIFGPELNIQDATIQLLVKKISDLNFKVYQDPYLFWLPGIPLTQRVLFPTSEPWNPTWIVLKNENSHFVGIIDGIDAPATTLLSYPQFYKCASCPSNSIGVELPALALSDCICPTGTIRSGKNCFTVSSQSVVITPSIMEGTYKVGQILSFYVSGASTGIFSFYVLLTNGGSFYMLKNISSSEISLTQGCTILTTLVLPSGQTVGPLKQTFVVNPQVITPKIIPSSTILKVGQIITAWSQTKHTYIKYKYGIHDNVANGFEISNTPLIFNGTNMIISFQAFRYDEHNELNYQPSETCTYIFSSVSTTQKFSVTISLWFLLFAMLLLVIKTVYDCVGTIRLTNVYDQLKNSQSFDFTPDVEQTLLKISPEEVIKIIETFQRFALSFIPSVLNANVNMNVASNGSCGLKLIDLYLFCSEQCLSLPTFFRMMKHAPINIKALFHQALLCEECGLFLPNDRDYSASWLVECNLQKPALKDRFKQLCRTCFLERIANGNVQNFYCRLNKCDLCYIEDICHLGMHKVERKFSYMATFIENYLYQPPCQLNFCSNCLISSCENCLNLNPWECTSQEIDEYNEVKVVDLLHKPQKVHKFCDICEFTEAFVHCSHCGLDLCFICDALIHKSFDEVHNRLIIT
eukprot:TRINITY_DN2123_c0_g1_i1.p1 TRINITY_DN2123_c0_g1~~TRINITY_DN2123_c0_g1_i1.p1  ORF type:complete len:1432 (-),score=328.12 TRINITY_DN2123_c0_g1_i1:302-4138(-)